MKNRTLLAALLWGAALIVACGDKNPVKPEPKDEDLIRATVGPAGGKLETDEFKITIPAGAFASPAELSLQVQTSPTAFGSFVRTRTFQLTGLPQTFSRGLTLSLQYQGMLKDSSFIVLAAPMDSPEGDSTLLSYSFFPARDSSGRMVCTIPARSPGLARSSRSFPGGSSQQEDLFDVIFGISEYDVRYYANVAVMKCPKIMLESLTTPILIIPYLSADKVRKMGLSFLEPEGLYEMEVAEFKALSASSPLYRKSVTGSNLEAPYTRSSTITFDVRLTKPVFTTARIKERTQGTHAGYDGSTTAGGGVLYVDDRWHEKTFTDNTFQASWNITTTDPKRE